MLTSQCSAKVGRNDFLRDSIGTGDDDGVIVTVSHGGVGQLKVDEVNTDLNNISGGLVDGVGRDEVTGLSDCAGAAGTVGAAGVLDSAGEASVDNVGVVQPHIGVARINNGHTTDTKSRGAGSLVLSSIGSALGGSVTGACGSINRRTRVIVELDNLKYTEQFAFSVTFLLCQCLLFHSSRGHCGH